MRRQTVTAWLLALILAGPATASDSRYTLTEIVPDNAHSRFVFARDLNASGFIVGDITTSAGDRGFVWRADIGLHDIGSLAGDGAMTTAQGISGSGLIVGSSRLPAAFHPDHAFLRDPERGLTDLGDLRPGDAFSRARAVNDDGVAVGSTWTGNRYRAFRWTHADGMMPLPLGLPENADSRATDINDAGQIVGHYRHGHRRHAFLWSAADGLRSLPYLRADDDTAVATAVSGGSHTVGRSGRNAVQEATLWRLGGPALGLGHLSADRTYSEALDVNEVGTVVGRALTDSGMRAFIWRSGSGMQRLDALLVDADRDTPPWRLISAVAINADGRIAAYGRRGDQPAVHSFLLTPSTDDTE